MKSIQSRLEKLESLTGLNSSRKIIIDNIGYDGIEAIPAAEVSSIARRLAAKSRFPVCIVSGEEILQAWEARR